MRGTEVTIFGAHSGRNKGDLAILHSMMANLKRAIGDVQFNIPTKNPSYLRQFEKGEHINYIKSPTNYLNFESSKSIKDSDIVLIGGGGLFFDRRIYNPFYNHVINIDPIARYSNQVGTPTALFCVGAHRMNRVATWLTKNILQRSDYISVRDHLSEQVFGSIADEQIHFRPDPALLLEEKYSGAVSQVLSAVSSKQQQAERLVFFVNSVVERSSVRSQVIESIRDLTEQYDVFIGETVTEQDHAREIASEINGCHLLFAENNLRGEEHIALISEFDIAVCIPMHSAIFAYKSKTPFVSIEYEPKVSEFNNLISNRSRTLLSDIDSVPRIVKSIDGRNHKEKEELETLSKVAFQDIAEILI
ncbi:polysaccharide pyruvyl transferase family protein [Haloarcula amylovorans]|uniref:polysaccharide pyruvyl transferase family protein n=1 Tax=Haloarcula amylovorans TaxID=2562280 RepID=UPI0010764287|nr:polysaccharide pyruvyl transferase family protein [Halomicroarcula amylolytica]